MSKKPNTKAVPAGTIIDTRAKATPVAKAKPAAPAKAVESTPSAPEAPAAKVVTYKTPELKFVRDAEAGKGGGVWANIRAGGAVLKRKVYCYTNTGKAFVAHKGGFSDVVLVPGTTDFEFTNPPEASVKAVAPAAPVVTEPAAKAPAKPTAAKRRVNLTK